MFASIQAICSIYQDVLLIKRLQGLQNIALMHVPHSRQAWKPCTPDDRGNPKSSALEVFNYLLMLPRQVMKNALLHCGASSGLVDLILHMHGSCRYHVQHGQHQAVIDMRRGVRQGCTLTPTLFAASTVYFQHLLSSRTSGAWTDSNLTLFAHIFWVIGCLHDLQKIPSMIQIVYDLFSQLGMKVNPSNSTIIFGIRGRAGKQWLKRPIIKKKEEQYVEMGSAEKPVHIPVKQQMVYFGIVVSYGQFEQQTLKHRHKTATLQKHRLIKILHSSQCDIEYGFTLRVSDLL